jgi:hypothetical protein
MKSRPLCLLAALVSFAAVSAEEHGTLIFQDDFERSESQEKTDAPGNGWGTNSKSRAKGNKQVDLKDGSMRIYIHAEADHAVSVTQPAEFTDGAVGLRFMLEDARDSLGLNFADLQFKEVHAGHLFAARVQADKVVLQDLKTNRSASATVRVVDAAGKAVSGAVVTGSWSGLASSNASSTTSRRGEASFKSPTVKTGGTFYFTVTGITASGFEYDPALNGETTDMIVIP